MHITSFVASVGSLARLGVFGPLGMLIDFMHPSIAVGIVLYIVGTGLAALAIWLIIRKFAR